MSMYDPIIKAINEAADIIIGNNEEPEQEQEQEDDE